MRQSMLCFAALLSVLVFAPIAHAAQSLQDQYLQIYLIIQEADKLEADGQKGAAYKKYDTALNRLQALPKDWEPGIVGYRIKFCKEKMAALQDSIDQGTTAAPENTGPGAVSTTNTPPANPGETTTLKQSVSELEVELNRTKRDLANAVQESKELKARLDATQKQLGDARSTNLNDKIADLTAQNQALRDQLNQAQTKTPEADQRIANLTQEIATLKEQLAQAQATTSSQVGMSDARYRTLDQKVNSLIQENNTLKTQLAKAQDENARLVEDARTKPTDQKVNELLAQNNTLKADLAKAEETIKTLQGGSSGSSVAALQAQLKKVEDQLAQQQQANAAFEQATNELKKQLDEARANLAQAKQQLAAAPNAASYQHENDVLRSIINRQMQEQARRDAAKKLAQEELDNLKVKSDVLRQQIDILGSPVMVLSEEERALLRAPSAQIASANTPNNVLKAPLTNAPDNAAASASSSTPSASAAPTVTTTNTENPVVDYRSKPRIPEDMRSIAQQASDFFAQKKYDEACAAYQKIIDRYPESLYAWSNMGVVRFQQQNYTEAQRALLQAVKLSPSDGFSYSILGIVYYQLGKYDDAINALTKAAALDPNDAKTLNYLGIACSQKGLQEAAEQQLRKAIELDPNYGDAHFNLAVIYATQKPPAKELAKRHYKQALDLGIPKDPQLDKMLLN